MITWRALMAGAVAFALLAGLAARAEGGEVELAIRGPDGKPVADRVVTLFISDLYSYGEPRSSTRTDQTGVARFDLAAPAGRVKVRVEGIGYGTTGVIQPGAGVTRAAMPPLAPFAVIAGSVPAGLISPKLKVSARSDDDQTIAIEPDANGHFRIEVTEGRWWVQASEGKRLLVESNWLLATGGLTVANVQFHKPDERDEPDEGITRAQADPKGEMVTWVRGTVRDTAGKPVANASVYAGATSAYGGPMADASSRTRTDAQGHYEVRGKADSSFFSAAVVAHVPGRPPAWGWFAWPDLEEPRVSAGTTQPAKVAAPPEVDLVIPRSGGKLEVRVTRGGKPAGNASVVLELQNATSNDLLAPDGNDATDAVEEAVSPARLTDKDGVARFDALLPGCYQVSARELSGREDFDPRQAARIVAWTHRGVKEAFGVANGVIVRPGETTVHRMSISVQPDTARLRALTRAGKPLPDDMPHIEYDRIGGGSGASTGLRVDAAGEGTHVFDGCGLWHVSIWTAPEGMKTGPIMAAHLGAEGIVAVSPVLNVKQPATFTARLFELCSVVVEVRDASGKPARGVVAVGPFARKASMIGSTDEKGMVRFEGLLPWPHKYTVWGHLVGQEFVDIGEYDDPLPAEGKLLGRAAVDYQEVEVQYNTTKRVVLQERPAGFVMGRLRLLAGHTGDEYAVYADYAGWPASRPGEIVHYQGKTGQFVGGPFPAGRVKLWLRRPGFDEEDALAVHEVNVEAGKVARVEFDAPVPPAGEEQRQTSGALGVSGRVLMADGRTPAVGAAVYYFPPKPGRPMFGLTDGAGVIHVKEFWDGRGSGPKPAVDAAGPVIVAMLPGACGPTTRPVELGKPVEVVLPAAMSIKGKVTVGGGAPPAEATGVRVLAVRKERGRFSSLSAVEVSAQSDGSFELGGVTAGEYMVQAALDDVWLSPGVMVNVGGGAAGPVVLAIPAPAGPVAVKVLNKAGKPAVGVGVRVERPAGPLTDVLWPKLFTTDGSGTAYIPALEKGEHAVRVEGDGRWHRVTPPALPADGPAEVEIRTKIEGESGERVGG